MASRTFKLPVFLIFLDGAGVALLVLGFLAATGTDFGLPALATIWPVLIVLGLGLMAPMVVWVVRKGLELRRQREKSEK